MGFEKLVLAVVVMVGMLTAVRGDCYRDTLREGWINGEMQFYCQTRETKPEIIPYGGKLDTKDCYRCTCDGTGLHCCGFGVKYGGNAQNIAAPPGCTLVVGVDCDYYFMDSATGGPCRG